MQLKFDDIESKATPNEPKSYTVSQIVQLASRHLETTFREVWVEGELSNLRCPASGHVYFTLKDAQAQIAVVMFRADIKKLKFELEDGQKLRCRGRLSIYNVQGRFQLTANVAEPLGAGPLQIAFEQLKRKLEAEGLFAAQHKKTLPFFPRLIAVVTSSTGAAVKDIVRILHDRFPVRVIICPTAVQGNEAPAEIALALSRADQLGADLIILGRGGGSIEDLWAFNTEVVARAIFVSQTPIISAVGHEIDITIADLVADHRAPTPSGAAEMAVPVMTDVQDQLRLYQIRLGRAIRQRLIDRTLHLERLVRRLGTPQSLVNVSRMHLDDWMSRLERAMLRRLIRYREQLAGLKTRLAAEEPRVRLARNRVNLQAVQTQLNYRMKQKLEQNRSAMTRLMAKLDALSPLAVLARGYGLVLNAERKIIHRLDSLQLGDNLYVQHYQGEINCTVNEIIVKSVPENSKEQG